MNTTSFHPSLSADDRGRGVGVEDDGQAVFKDVSAGAGRGKLHVRNLGVDRGFVQALILLLAT